MSNGLQVYSFGGRGVLQYALSYNKSLFYLRRTGVSPVKNYTLNAVRSTLTKY